VHLDQPSWTTDGEILNMDRFVFLLRPQYDFGRKFTLEKTEPDAFWKMNHFLDQIAQPSGFLYKDVVQPFVMARWLKKRSFPTLIIRRPVADVVYAMTARGWNYPGIMFSNLMDNELAVVKGLARAARALDMIPGHFIDFDELVFSEEVVYRALRSFYPKVDARRVQYIDAKFEGVRGEILARRKTEKYQAIVEMLATDAGATSKA
jgi:hypothetical protein